MKTNSIVTGLSILILLLAVIAAGAGVFWQGTGESYPFTTLRGETFPIFGHGLYRYDTVSYAAQAIAQDAVTLVVGIPILLVGIVLTRKGSRRGSLLLTGALGYFLYTYTSLTFLAAYNPLFLVYVALFSLSLFAFILALRGLDPAAIASRVTAGFPRGAIIVFLSLVAAFLILAWLGRIVPPLLADVPPVGLEAYTTLVIQAMDLGVIVPASALTAVLLWQKRPWGYTLAYVLLIKGVMFGIALVAMIIGMLLAGVGINPVEAVVFSLIPVVGVVLITLALRNMR